MGDRRTWGRPWGRKYGDALSRCFTPLSQQKTYVKHEGVPAFSRSPKRHMVNYTFGPCTTPVDLNVLPQYTTQAKVSTKEEQQGGYGNDFFEVSPRARKQASYLSSNQVNNLRGSARRAEAAARLRTRRAADTCRLAHDLKQWLGKPWPHS
ncbi:hypothetical protein BC567DRAFT_64935 [Phyllosticta citribraziliensis]